MKQIEKSAGLATMFGGHVLQNGYTKRLMTADTGKSIVGRLSNHKPILSSVKAGLMNVVSPELGVLEGELRHGMNAFVGASIGERAAALALMKGQLGKVLGSKTFAKSPKLRALAEKMNLNEVTNHANSHKNIKGALAPQEKIYRNHPIGRLIAGMAGPLAKIEPAAVKKSDYISNISEVLGNAAMATHEPGIPVINLVKRYTGLAHDGQSAVSKAMKKVKKVVSRKLISEPSEASFNKGLTGRKRSLLTHNSVSYAGNPLTAGIHDLSHQLGATIRKQQN